MIDTLKIQAVGIDYQAGLSRFMNNPKLYEAVLRAFVEVDVISRSNQAYEAHDYDQLLRIVHEAKGSSGNAGFDDLYRISSELVKFLRTKDFSEVDLCERYQNFVSTYENIQKCLKAALSD